MGISNGNDGALETALGLIDQGVLIVDGEQKVVFVNAYVLDLFNLTPDRLKPGDNFHDFMRDGRRKAGLGHGEDEPELLRLKMREVATFETKMKGRRNRIVQTPLPRGGFVRVYTEQ